MNRLPMSFTATGQIDKMKQMIRTFVSGSAGKVRSIQNAMQWIESGFNIEAIPKAAIDELSELAKVAQDKNKIAVTDLLRLLVLKGEACEYIITKHWGMLDESIFLFLQKQNLSDPNAKII